MKIREIMNVQHIIEKKKQLGWCAHLMRMGSDTPVMLEYNAESARGKGSLKTVNRWSKK